jgi:hypothetical protein
MRKQPPGWREPSRVGPQPRRCHGTIGV